MQAGQNPRHFMNARRGRCILFLFGSCHSPGWSVRVARWRGTKFGPNLVRANQNSEDRVHRVVVGQGWVKVGACQSPEANCSRFLPLYFGRC